MIQSIPSPKAEPFKRWLASVGAERLQEIENPELAMARTRALYEQKGYDAAWIEARMRGMAVRDTLTEPWRAMHGRHLRLKADSLLLQPKTISI